MKFEINNQERIFLFIDETGDPGHPDQRDSSRSYQLNVVVANRDGIKKIVKHFSRFRYFHDAGKELEKYTRSIDKLCDLFQVCSDEKNIGLYSFFLNKESYMGPYLKKIKKGKSDYNPNKFRNFIVRKSLEALFNEILPRGYDRVQEIELIFDRYLVNEEDEQNLKEYLRGNYNLPPFLHIVQIDSEYSDLVQVADLLGRIIKKSLFDGHQIDTDFASLFCLENPDSVEKRKGSGHSRRAPDPFHL